MNHTPAQGTGTPRVDARAVFHVIDGHGYHIVEADFARQLETELTAALAERDKAREAKRPFSDALAQKVIDGQVKELDRLRELVAFHSARFDKLNDDVRIVAGIRDGIETVCGLTAALSSHAEGLERLQKIIDDAPHKEGCWHYFGGHCNCWKAAALRP